MARGRDREAEFDSCRAHLSSTFTKPHVENVNESSQRLAHIGDRPVKHTVTDE